MQNGNFNLTVTRSGQVFEVSSNDNGPVPPFVRHVIENNFCYKLEQFMPGSVNDPITGAHSQFMTDRRNLFIVDEVGRVIFGLGYQKRFSSIASMFGWNLRWVDIPPPQELDPYRFYLDWEGVRNVMSATGTQFKYRQEEFLNTIAANNMGQIDAAPSFGKTFLFRLIAVMYPRARIHIIVPGKDLIKSTLYDLRSFFTTVGEVRGGHDRWARITVISADSLHKIEFDDVTSFRFGDVVLVDEAHKICTGPKARFISQYKWCFRFAFSGTIQDRGDNAHLELEQIFGPIIFSVTTKELHQSGASLPARVLWLPIKYPRGLGNGILNSSVLYSVAVAFNDYRNAVFASFLSTMMDNQTLVIVKTVDHAVQFKQFAPWFRMCYGSGSMDAERYRSLANSGLIDPSVDPFVSPIVRDEMRQAFRAGEIRHIVSTPIWGTGVNFENLQILVRMAADRSDITSGQEPHRVIRLPNGIEKQYGLVIDGTDEFNSVLNKRAEHRKSRYNRFGWKNIRVKESQIPCLSPDKPSSEKSLENQHG